MREFATTDKGTDHEGIPRQLRTWLAGHGLTLAQWRADPRFKSTGRIVPPASLPGRPALSIARRRQALVDALRR